MRHSEVNLWSSGIIRLGYTVRGCRSCISWHTIDHPSQVCQAVGIDRAHALASDERQLNILTEAVIVGEVGQAVLLHDRRLLRCSGKDRHTVGVIR